MVIKKCAQIYGCYGGVQMDGPHAIPDPPPIVLPLTVGGGGGGPE
jgi:hypothetical protein